MKRRIFWVAPALLLAGCASNQAAGAASTEQMLIDAGFETRTADTPEKLASLQSLPARKLLVQTVDGQSQYGYADPTGCKCLYVGTERQYQEFQKLRNDRAVAVERLRDTRQRGALDSIWKGSGSLQY
jgi:hypothetical protein